MIQMIQNYRQSEGYARGYIQTNMLIGLNQRIIDVYTDLCRMTYIDLKITSGLRTPEQNLKAGGAKNSSHLKGLAIDISIPDNKTRYIVLDALFKLNIKRIGVYKNHIHIDVDSQKIPYILWTDQK